MVRKFKKVLKDFLTTVRNSEDHANLARSMNANILSMNTLESLIDENFRKYIPFTDYALSPYTITHILNDMTINSRKNIVEFGSGASTIYIALYMKKHNIGQSFVSFDQDSHWLETIQSTYLNDISLANNQKFNLIHAPLLPTNFGKKDEARWYSEEIVNSNVNDPVHCIIVDGPTGDINRFARYPVINFIVNHLSEDGVVFIDDAKREGEKEIINVLVDKYGFKRVFTLSHCVLTRNATFLTRPIGDYLG